MFLIRVITASFKVVERFAKNYLPKDLAIVSLRFPEERVMNSLAIQTPKLPHHELEKQILKSVEVSEKGALDSFIRNHIRDNPEHDVWKYLPQLLKSSRTLIIHSYDRKIFRLFLNGKAFQSDEKEMDFIVLFGAYEIYVNIEVKAEEYKKKTWIKQVEKGQKFYQEVLSAMGKEGYKDWEYIPVDAFLNLNNKSQAN